MPEQQSIKDTLDVIRRSLESDDRPQTDKITDNVLILNKIVVIKIEKNTWDKYGRLLGTIYSKIIPGITMKAYNLNVNEYMIKKELGYKYYGGTKKS